MGGGASMRRRVVFLVAVMMAVLAMAGGAALAVTIDGTRGSTGSGDRPTHNVCNSWLS